MNEHTYSELISLPTFKERFEYLKLGGSVGRDTFGFARYLNQRFYNSMEWKNFRNEIIVRDNACDLGIDDGLHDIHGKILIHHLDPITKEDILAMNACKLLNPENAICVSHLTHEAIHYGAYNNLIDFVERKPGDTCPWR